ncbi:unnamed protein product [Rotaria socialis]|nr:unnamed protein product [Rotaria socialis]
MIFSVGTDSRKNLLYCHVYSCPHTWTFYHNITNNFPSELFRCVRVISLHDECPFEHDFYLRIAHSSPFIKKLNLHNYQSQQNDHAQWPIIKYPHLIEIDLVKTHEDYLEELLNNRKIYLLDNVHLRVSYDSLKNQRSILQEMQRVLIVRKSFVLWCLTIQ